MKELLKRSYLALIYFFLYAPLLVLMVLSFNASSLTTKWEGFSFKWYIALAKNGLLIDAFTNSLIVAISAATIVTVIGAFASVTLYRYNFFGKNFIMLMLYTLMMSPEIIMGISLLILFITIKMPLGFTTLLITHVTICLPFVMTVLLARLSGFDIKQIEAAKDLGANEIKTFWHVILPSLAPAVVAAWMLSFTLSMDDSITSFFVAGPTFEVLPLRIYSMVRLGIKPEVNALSALIFMISMLMVVIARLLLRERKK